MKNRESSALANLAIIFAFIIPIVGLILGIVGMNKYNDPQLRNKARSGMLFSLSILIIYVFIFSVFLQL